MVAVQGEPDLLEVAGAADAVGGLADLLDGGQEQADQHGDNRDDDEQLDECESGSAERMSILLDAVNSLGVYQMKEVTVTATTTAARHRLKPADYPARRGKQPTGGELTVEEDRAG